MTEPKVTKNKLVMSMAIKPEVQEKLTRYAHRKQVSRSEFIGNLLEQALKLDIDDDAVVIGRKPEEDVIPVILKVPASVRSDPDKLRQWLDGQSAGIVKALTKGDSAA